MLFYASLYYPWIFISSAEKSPKLGDFFNTKSKAERDKGEIIQKFINEKEALINEDFKKAFISYIIL